MFWDRLESKTQTSTHLHILRPTKPRNSEWILRFYAKWTYEKPNFFHAVFVCMHLSSFKGRSFLSLHCEQETWNMCQLRDVLWPQSYEKSQQLSLVVWNTQMGSSNLTQNAQTSAGSKNGQWLGVSSPSACSGRSHWHRLDLWVYFSTQLPNLLRPSQDCAMILCS